MSFCFNFNSEVPLESENNVVTSEVKLEEVLNFSDHHFLMLQNELPTQSKEIKDFSFTYVSSSYIEECVKTGTSELKDVLLQNSDVQAGIYEGGLKLWECAIDLVEYLINSKFKLKHDCEVLELGCGVGLPAIYCLSNGANITCQDYNKEVLDLVTIPNVLLNTSTKNHNSLKSRCNFIACDWKKMDSVPNNKFDLILTSETIYNPINQLHLYNAIKSKLKHDGVAFVAAKVYYFGVGGGIRKFEELINLDGVMQTSVVFQSEEGLQREILKLQFKNNEIEN